MWDNLKARFHSKYRELFDNEADSFAREVFELIFNFMNEDYDKDNYGIVSLFENEEFSSLYSRYCDNAKCNKIFKESINEVSKLDYSFLTNREISTSEELALSKGNNMFKKYFDIKKATESWDKIGNLESCVPKDWKEEAREIQNTLKYSKYKGIIEYRREGKRKWQRN